MTTRPLPRWLAATLVVVLAGCTSTTTPGSSVDAASPGSPAPTPAPPDTGLARQGDAIVRIDVSSGQVTDRTAIEDGAGADDLELSDTRGVAVLTRPRPDGPDELVEVTLADGSTRVLGHGHRPAVSDDGSHLAFVRTSPDGEHRELVAATYEGGEEGVWPIVEAPPEEVEVLGLAWSATGEELAVTLRSSAGPEVRVLPLDRTGTLRGASEVVPPTSHGAELVAATYRGPGRLTVAEGCCTPGAHERWRVLDVGHGTWTTSEVVAGLAGPVTHLDWDPALTHLLITLEGTPALQRWGVDGLQDVGVDATSAEW